MGTIKCKSCEDHKLVFVFGSNEAGIHGAGAAKHAYEFHAAEHGLGFGPQAEGSDDPDRNAYSFSIPTKDKQINTLPLDKIEEYVKRFIGYAIYHPDFTFNITRIGCGLAGYRDEDIAPMFRSAPSNCILPEEFKKILDKETKV